MADIHVESRRSAHNDSRPLESDLAHFHPLVSWRSVIAGLLVAVLTLAILLSLGMAFGGIGLDGGASLQGAGIFTGVWFLVSSIIALFSGAYFAARVSKFHTNRIGAAQGLVIASLFFTFFLYQTFSAIGWVGGQATSAISGTASLVGSGASQAAGNPTVNAVVEDALADLNLRSEPQVVASGLAQRLLSGNTEGAKNYLAAQAGLTPEQAEQRINAVQTQASQALAQARDATATALQATGWSLFATLLLGAAASIGGGALGSAANLRKPLTREQEHAVTDYREVHA